MTDINVNLTGQQVLDIANALNTEAARLRAVDKPKRRPGAEVREQGAASLRYMANQLIHFKATADTRNPHVPCVISWVS